MVSDRPRKFQMRGENGIRVHPSANNSTDGPLNGQTQHRVHIYTFLDLLYCILLSLPSYIFASFFISRHECVQDSREASEEGPDHHFNPAKNHHKPTKWPVFGPKLAAKLI